MKPGFLVSAALLLCPVSVALAAAPDAGSLQQQFRRDQPQLPDQGRVPKSEPMDKLPVTGPTMVVKGFRLAGNTLLGEGELLPIIDDFTDRPVTFNELQMAAAAIGEAYKQAGWMAKVYVPQQSVDDGIVTLQIIESRFGQLVTLGETVQRVNPGLPVNYIAEVQQRDQFLATKNLDRALLLLDDLPGITAAANLAAGEQPQQTDILLSLGDEPLYNGVAAVDNFGSRSTGPERLVLDASVNSPRKVGDQLRANVTLSEGSQYLWLNYSQPIGFNGLRIGINGSLLDYEIIAPEFSSADLTGNSSTLGFSLSYPLVRENARNLYLGADYEQKNYHNQANTGTTSHYHINNLRTNLYGNLFDRLGGGGANFLSLTLTAGELHDNSASALLDGAFTKFSYTVSRQQALTTDLSLFASLSGQLADGNLDSSEKFYLGGPFGVRAYPVNEGGGDEGLLAKSELRYRLRSDLVVTGFYDWGKVRQYKDNSTAATPNVFELDGAGLLLTWTGPKGMIVNATYAHRIGDNPNPLTNDQDQVRDQDGSLDKDRLWLSASIAF